MKPIIAFVVGAIAVSYLAIHVVEQYSLAHLCTGVAFMSLLVLFLITEPDRRLYESSGQPQPPQPQGGKEP